MEPLLITGLCCPMHNLLADDDGKNYRYGDQPRKSLIIPLSSPPNNYKSLKKGRSHAIIIALKETAAETISNL